MSQTLIDLIDNLKTERSTSSFSLRKQSSQSASTVQEIFQNQSINEECKSGQFSTRTWTKEDDSAFQKLIDVYGSDFTMIQANLPKYSRKQIKKRFDKFESLRERKLSLLNKLRKQRLKKSIFEDDILEVDDQQKEANTQTNKNKINQNYL